MRSNKYLRAFVSLLFLVCSVTLSAQTPTVTGTYYHTDALGSIVAASDEQGTILWRKTYDPYGNEVISTEDGNEFEGQAYTGKPYDEETGLVYLGQRYYDPQIKRFMGMDPVGFRADTPVSFNRYAYANNNPYKFTDPDGRTPELTFGADPNLGLNIARARGEISEGRRRELLAAQSAGGLAGVGGGAFIVCQFFKLCSVPVNAGMFAGTGDPLDFTPLGTSSKVVLNLGSGSNPMKNAINLDLRASEGVNVVADANKLPFAPKTFDEVHAINPYGFNPVTIEIAQVIKPGGLLIVSGTPRNLFAQPFSASATNSAGFELVGTGPLLREHLFGIQRATTGGRLNTSSSSSTIYRRVE